MTDRGGVTSAVQGSTIALTPSGPWSWATGEAIKVPIEEARLDLHIDGKPVLESADIERAVANSVPGAGYRHCAAAKQAGSVGEARASVDASTLSQAVRIAGTPIATGATKGTFSICAAVPSVIPGSPPSPDMLGIHRGRWQVIDPGTQALVEHDARAHTGAGGAERALSRNTQTERETDTETKFTLILSVNIDNGPLAGTKARQDVTVRFANGTAKISSDRTWYGTHWKNTTFAPITEDIIEAPQIDEVRTNRNEARFRIRGSAKTSLVRHLGGEAGERAGKAAWLWAAVSPGKANIILLILGKEWCRRTGRKVGAEIAERMTPNIEYELDVRLDRAGHGSIRGRHREFPSYRIFLEDPVALRTRVLHEHAHAQEVVEFKEIDMRPIYSRSDLGVKLAALATWRDVNTTF